MMHGTLFIYFCIRNFVGSPGEDFSTVKLRSTPSGFCYRPFEGGGTGVILILCAFLGFTTRSFLLSSSVCFSPV